VVKTHDSEHSRACEYYGTPSEKRSMDGQIRSLAINIKPVHVAESTRSATGGSG